MNAERYDSFFELLYMQLLDADNSVRTWTKAHGIRILYHWSGAIRTYVPDFLIERGDQRVIVEVKGYEEPSKLNAKLNALEEHCEDTGVQYEYVDHGALEQRVHAVYGCSIATLRKRGRTQ